MTTPSIPPVLLRSWARCAPAATGADRDACLAAWDEPHRRYHDRAHLVDGLTQLEPLLDQATDPRAIELAWWYHDLVYDPLRADNEAQSAARATADLARWGEAPARIAAVAALILDTRHQADPAPGDPALLIDVDLAILAAEPARFDAYEAQIRAEYAWVPDALFAAKRAEILAQFLARTAIYRTPSLHARWEDRARANLARAVIRWRG